MEETDKNNDVSKISDESNGNTFENLARELADYREALCRLVIVSEDNHETYFNSFQEDEISNDGSMTVKKPAVGKKECSDTSIKSDRVRDRFSVDNKIKISDLGIREFHPRNSKSTYKKAMIPNVRTVAGKPRKRSDLMIRINSKTSETLNTSCRGAQEVTCTSNTVSSDYRSEATTNNSDKDTNASSDCNSQTSTTDFQFSESDSSIASLYLKISEKYLGASSTRIFTEENLRRFCSTINQDSSEVDFLNCNSETLTNLTNYSQHSTEEPASFKTTDDDRGNQELELKSSEDPETVLDNTSPNSNPNSGGILGASDRNSEYRNSGLSISISDSEICHSISKVSDTDQFAEPDKDSSEVLRTKLRNLVKTFDEFQDASVKTFEDLIEDFSDFTPTLDNDQEASFSFDVEMKKEVPTKTTNAEDKCGSLNTPICPLSPASNSNQSNVFTFSDYSEYWNSDFKFSDSDEESCHTDIMFKDSNNESKSDKRSSNALHVQKELQNLINTNDEVQDLGQEEIMASEVFSSIELTSDNDLETSDSLPETKGNEVTTDSTIADEQCDRLESLVYFKDTNATAEFQNISKEVNTAGTFSNMEFTSDNDLEDSASSQEAKRNEVSVYSQNTTDEEDCFEALICSKNTTVNDWFQFIAGKEINTEVFSNEEKPGVTPWRFQALYQKEVNSEAFSNNKLTSDNGIVTSASLPETTVNEATADSTIVDNQCDRLQSLEHSDEPRISAEFQNIIEEVTTAEEFSNIKLTLGDDLGIPVRLHETKGNEISAYSKNTKDECDRLEVLVCGHPNTSWTDDFQGQEVINTEALSNIELTSDYGPVTPTSSQDRKRNKAAIPQLDLQHAIAYVEKSALSDINVSDINNHSILLSHIDEVLKFCRLPPDEIKKLKELRNLLNSASKDAMNIAFSIQKRDTTVESSSKMKPIFPLGNEHTKLVGSHRTNENEMSFKSFRSYNMNRQTVVLSQKGLLDYLTKGNSIGGESSSTSDSNYESSTDTVRYTEDERRQTVELNPRLPIKNNRKISIDRLEIKDNHSDTLDYIFKRVIKCHPIKKFPFESPNTEKTLMKSKDSVKKDICSTIERYGFEHRNILEAISNADRDSVVVLDVTDSFSQNSSIICDGLIKEYLDISAKVDLLLVKRIKYLSAEEWEIRMHNVLTLDDELGYINAKLIKTMNDWVKQFRDIEKNIGQSITGSQAMYHMGILEICLQLLCILLDFIYNKQLDLENYENALRLER